MGTLFVLEEESTTRLGTLLEKAGIVTSGDIAEAVAVSKRLQTPIGRVLIMSGCVTERTLTAALEAQAMLRDRTIHVEAAIEALTRVANERITLSEALTQTDKVPQPGTSTNKLGEILIQFGLIDNKTLEAALQTSAESGMPLGSSLVCLGAIPPSLLPLLLRTQEQIRDGAMTMQEAVEDFQSAYAVWKRAEESFKRADQGSELMGAKPATPQAPQPGAQPGGQPLPIVANNYQDYFRKLAAQAQPANAQSAMTPKPVGYQQTPAEFANYQPKLQRSQPAPPVEPSPGTRPASFGMEQASPGTRPPTFGLDQSSPGTRPTSYGLEAASPGTRPPSHGVDQPSPGTRPPSYVPEKPSPRTSSIVQPQVQGGELPHQQYQRLSVHRMQPVTPDSASTMNQQQPADQMTEGHNWPTPLGGSAVRDPAASVGQFPPPGMNPPASSSAPNFSQSMDKATVSSSSLSRLTDVAIPSFEKMVAKQQHSGSSYSPAATSLDLPPAQLPDSAQQSTQSDPPATLPWAATSPTDSAAQAALPWSNPLSTAQLDPTPVLPWTPVSPRDISEAIDHTAPLRTSGQMPKPSSAPSAPKLPEPPLEAKVVPGAPILPEPVADPIPPSAKELDPAVDSTIAPFSDTESQKVTDSPIASVSSTDLEQLVASAIASASGTEFNPVTESMSLSPSAKDSKRASDATCDPLPPVKPEPSPALTDDATLTAAALQAKNDLASSLTPPEQVDELREATDSGHNGHGSLSPQESADPQTVTPATEATSLLTNLTKSAETAEDESTAKPATTTSSADNESATTSTSEQARSIAESTIPPDEVTVSTSFSADFVSLNEFYPDLIPEYVEVDSPEEVTNGHQKRKPEKVKGGAKSKKKLKDGVQEECQPVLSLVEILKLGGFFTQKEIIAALNSRLEDPATALDVLFTIGLVDKDIINGALTCQSLLRDGNLRPQQAAYVLSSLRSGRMTLDSALEEVGAKPS